MSSSPVSPSAPPLFPSQAQRLLAQVVLDTSSGGTLSACLPNYQQRTAQITLAMQIVEAMTHERIALIEAGTGVGKSLAYLIPAIRSGQVTVISTANKTLQDQLYFKDIPFLQQHLEPFEAALMKGMGTYLCLLRVERAGKDPDVYPQEGFQRLVQTLDDRPQYDGDLDQLGFALPHEIRARVNGDPDGCTGKHCEQYASCFVYAMRERVRRARIIVVNHTLLLLDELLENALLPAHELVVLDEAHHLEEEATAVCTQVIKPGQVFSLLNLQALQGHTSPRLRDEVKTLATQLWQQVEQLPWTTDPKLLLVKPLPLALALASKLEELARDVRVNRPSNQDEKAAALYDRLVNRTETLAQTTRQVLTIAHADSWVYYAEREVRPGGSVRYQVCMAPLDVTPLLQKVLGKGTMILTSATLATGPTSVPAQRNIRSGSASARSPFAYFRSRIGLDEAVVAEGAVQECVLSSAFDYAHQAILYLPRHLPEPTYEQGEQLERYQAAVAEEMRRLVEASGGRAFLLFSSKRMLDETYCRLAPALPYLLLRQGEMSRTELVRRFREENSSVLFGLRTFWEGVDIAGDALSLVVMDKLPFAPPNDPVDRARITVMKARGQDWFGEFILPRAILHVKQGMGRLLRTQTDWGGIALLDTRLSTRGYGPRVLAALPPARQTSSLEEVRAFFRAQSAVGPKR